MTVTPWESADGGFRKQEREFHAVLEIGWNVCGSVSEVKPEGQAKESRLSSLLSAGAVAPVARDDLEDSRSLCRWGLKRKTPCLTV